MSSFCAGVRVLGVLNLQSSIEGFSHADSTNIRATALGCHQLSGRRPNGPLTGKEAAHFFRDGDELGIPEMHCFLFLYLGVSLLKLNIRKKLSIYISRCAGEPSETNRFWKGNMPNRRSTWDSVL